MCQIRLAVLSLPLLALTACGKVEASTTIQASSPAGEAKPVRQPAPELTDAELPDATKELLGVALESASALPHEPHIKNRSRAQASVLDTCLELDQPERALHVAEQIDNWRRGLGYADLAVYCARKGSTSNARRLISLAEAEVTQKEEAESDQAWRRDRIVIRIAQARALMGDKVGTEALEEGIVPSEVGRIESARAAVSEESQFDAHLEVVETIAQTSDFQQIRNGLETCSQLFDRFYDDADRRDRAEATIKKFWGSLPLNIRIEIALDLSDHAVSHGDPSKGLSLVEEAREIFDSVGWTPEEKVSLASKLAQARFASGDQRLAHRRAEETLAFYEESSEEIVDIFRADALRPLARAFDSMGDRATSALVYRMALEEGVHNPNSRPRAEDLTATCLSMASHGFEPEPELWKRIEEICNALAAPW